MPKSAEWYRRTYEDVSTSTVAAQASGDVTLITVRNASYQIFVQKITAHVQVTTTGTWQFESGTGGSGTPIVWQVGAITAPDDKSVDFGARGVALDAGESLALDVGTAGTLVISIEAYQKPAVTINAQAGASSQ